MKNCVVTLLLLGLCGCPAGSNKPVGQPPKEADAVQQAIQDVDVDTLALALKQTNPTRRAQAVEGLEAIGRKQPQKAPAAMRALLQAVDDPADDVAETAAYAVAELGEESAEAAKLALPAMVKVMQDSKRALAVRLGAARALGEIGERQPQLPEVQATVEPLIGALKEKAEQLRSMAVWSLREIGLKNPSAVQAALPALQEVAERDDSADVRKEAALVLQRIKTAGGGM